MMTIDWLFLEAAVEERGGAEVDLVIKVAEPFSERQTRLAA